MVNHMDAISLTMSGHVISPRKTALNFKGHLLGGRVNGMRGPCIHGLIVSASTPRMTRGVAPQDIRRGVAGAAGAAAVPADSGAR